MDIRKIYINASKLNNETRFALYSRVICGYLAELRRRKASPHYAVLGVDGYWRFTQEKMEQFMTVGREGL